MAGMLGHMRQSMDRDSIDTSDTLTLSFNLRLKNILTVSVSRTDTLKCQRSVSEVSREVSVKCQCVE